MSTEYGELILNIINDIDNGMPNGYSQAKLAFFILIAYYLYNLALLRNAEIPIIFKVIKIKATDKSEFATVFID